jgi:uncharacterized protein (TIGR04141 family)
VEALGLQVDREMFQSITGRSRREGEGRIHGSTSLGITRSIDVADLERLGVELLDAYVADTYQTAFPTLDRMRPMARTDPIVATLGEQLIRNLRSGEPSAYLAPPQILDWEGVSGFRLSTARDTLLDEPELRDYLDSVAAPLTLEDLMRDEVRVVDRDSPRVIARSPIMRWLVWEFTLDDRAFVLSDGRWYRIDPDYVRSVDEVVAGIPSPRITLPPPSRAMAEDAYNREAAAALNGVLLDRQLARVGTERGGFELCDVFVPPNHLVHVKRGMGSQALTYLFAQGVQSAEGLRHARAVRERLAQLVGAHDAAAAAALPVNRPRPGELEVVYAVVTGAPQRVPRTMPFFARAALARASRTLEDYDFSVSIAGVRS